jgi:hypothetical protein
MSKKVLNYAGKRPMLLAILVMATFTLGLLFSGWFTPTAVRAQTGGGNPTPNVETNCGPQSNGSCVECGPYTNAWTLDYCPSQTNSSGVDPSVIYVGECESPTAPTNVVAPIYQDGQKETHTSYDCTNTTYQYAGISYTVDAVKWNPDTTNWPTIVTNTFSATAYVNVTSSDTNMCPSPGRVNIGGCTWNAITVDLAGGDDDGSQASAAQAVQAASAPTCQLTGKKIWWFNGEAPANYARSTTASAHNVPSGSTVTWEITGPVTPHSGTGSSITLTSTGPSASAKDVVIKTKVDGKQVATVFVTVLAPASLHFITNVDDGDSTWGYLTQVHYSILDQFSVTLPSDVPINEHWTGPQTSDYTGTMDWTRGPNGFLTVSPSHWYDLIGGASSGHTPTPVGPTDATAGTTVCQWPGTWNVGSLNPGDGVTVKTLNWQKYEGYARHE